MMLRIENLILTVWVGSLLSIGYIAAPVLFSVLDDRSLAGLLAGKMFRIVGFLGLLSGLLLLVMAIMRKWPGNLKQWRFWVVAVMTLLVAASVFVLQPMMADLKLQGLAEGSESAGAFARLHGVSSLLYLVTSLLGLVLVVAGGSVSRRTSGS